MTRAQEKIVGVLLSREIGPYVSMVEGFESGINASVHRFFLGKKGRPYSLSGRHTSLDPLKFDGLVAVGPEAFQFLSSSAGSLSS